MSKERINKNAALLAAVIFFASTTGTACADGRLPSAAAVRADTGVVTEDTEENVADDGSGEIKDTDAYELMESSADGEHVITADGEDASYSELKIQKTGDSEGDEADFYGENSAVFATNGATLNLSDISVNTSGTHANAVFSYHCRTGLSRGAGQLAAHRRRRCADAEDSGPAGRAGLRKSL